MKGRRKKGIAAVFMAALMLIGLVPSDFTLVSAKAGDGVQVTEHIDVLQTEGELATGNGGLKAGTKYGDEKVLTVEVLEDMPVKDVKDVKISNVTYKGNVQGSTNVKPGKGAIPSGKCAAFKINAVDATKVTFVVKQATGKAYYFIKDNNGTAKTVKTDTTIADNCELEFNVEKNSTYYFYLQGSKPCVYDITYSYEKANDYKKTSVSVADGLLKANTYGDSEIANINVLSDMPYKAASKSINGVSYTGYVQGSANVASGEVGGVPTGGTAVKITAIEDSKITFVTKKADKKSWYFVENGKTEAQTGSGVDDGEMQFSLKKGGEYYFYLKGSKLALYGITLEKGTPALDWSTVKAPELATPTVDGDTVKVPYTAVIGSNGGEKLTVEMKDASGKVVDTEVTKADGTSGAVEFKPSATGAYSFVATLSRDGKEDKASNSVNVNFTLPLAKPVITTASSAGNGGIKVEWNKVAEATGYEVYCNGKLAGTTDKLEYTVTGLTIGTEYSFTVVAVRGEAGSETSDAVKATATDKAEIAWQFSAYGTGVDSENNGYKKNSDNNVTVFSMGGKGKIVPASTDGLAFYYTKIPVTSNFTLTAKVHADEWTLSNGQEGFGLMAADRVGTNGDTTTLWNNSYQAIASKVEYYVNEETNEVSDAGKRISMKLGLGVIAKSGVTADNLAKFNASDTETVQNVFKTETLPLDTSAMNKESGTYNVIGNGQQPVKDANGVITGYKNMDVSKGLTALTDYYITIQKNNTGYFVTYADANGKVIKTQKYYDTDALSQIDKDNVYVGFFASRNAKATFSDIDLKLTDPKDDPAPESKPLKLVTPRYTVTSATATGNAEYLFRFISTADGRLTIGGRDVEDEYVKANVEFTKKYTLTEGENNFVITFTPDPDFVPLKGDKLTSYEPYTFTHTVKFKTYGEAKESIWIAPDGSAMGTGEKSAPLDIYTAVKYAQPGQQIIMKGGKYDLYSTVTTGRGNNGTEGGYITMMADPDADERPVLDFNYSCAGMILAGDYWYFKGFDVTHSADAQKGIQVSGSHNVLDQINTYHNGNTGIQISRYLTSDTWNNWPSYNLILNCTSYGNADKGYEDADGFAAKLTIADGNVFDGCIAHHNADDGWDLYAKVETGSIGSVIIQNCVAYSNGYLEDGTNAGNGNGFKMGGDSLSGYHRLINSVAYNNKAKGIDSNSCPDIQVASSTTFNNKSYNVAFYTNTAANTDFGANGVLSYRKDTNVSEQFKTTGTQDESKIYGDSNYYWDDVTQKSSNKSGSTVTDEWFVSTNTSNGPTRNADGTINMNGLLVLTDKAPAGVGARISGTPSAVIEKKESVYYPTDPNEEIEEKANVAITNPDVNSSVNVLGQNVVVSASAGTVIKNAAGATVTAGDVYVKAVPKAADDSTAASILEAAKNQGLKIADNAGVAYYEVELVDAAGNPLTFEGTITISFAYPDGTNADGFTFSVLHLLKSGTLDVIDPALNQAGLSVNVTEFSPFAVVYLQKAANGEAGQTIESAKTGDSTPIMPIVVILLASAAVICAGIVVSKKKRA